MTTAYQKRVSFSVDLRDYVAIFFENPYSETVSAHRHLGWISVSLGAFKQNYFRLVSRVALERPQIIQFGVFAGISKNETARSSFRYLFEF